MATLRNLMLSFSPSSQTQLSPLASTFKARNKSVTQNKVTFGSSLIPDTDQRGSGLSQVNQTAKLTDSLEGKNFSLQYVSARSKPIEESTNLPAGKLERIVKDVNFLSKQLLSDLKEKNPYEQDEGPQEEEDSEQEKEENELMSYYQAMATVTEPALPKDPENLLPGFEYKTLSPDSKSLRD